MLQYIWVYYVSIAIRNSGHIIHLCFANVLCCGFNSKFLLQVNNSKVTQNEMWCYRRMLGISSSSHSRNIDVPTENWYKRNDYDKQREETEKVVSCVPHINENDTRISWYSTENSRRQTKKWLETIQQDTESS